MKKRSVKAVAAVMAVLMIGTFAACKKDPEDAVGSTSEESSRNAWLDETLATEAALSEIVTDENGETRVIEYETDATGAVVTTPEGTKVTKPAATEAAATTGTTTAPPQGGGNTTTVTTTRPPITTATTKAPPPVDPTPPPTNPPSQGVEYTPEVKESIKQELAAYARQCGWQKVRIDQMGDNVGDEFAFTANNYDNVINTAKGYIRELVVASHYPEKYINIQWGTPQGQWNPSGTVCSLYIYFA